MSGYNASANANMNSYVPHVSAAKRMRMERDEVLRSMTGGEGTAEADGDKEGETSLDRSTMAKSRKALAAVGTTGTANITNGNGNTDSEGEGEEQTQDRREEEESSREKEGRHVPRRRSKRSGQLVSLVEHQGYCGHGHQMGNDRRAGGKGAQGRLHC
jgi:hypothetical protein